MNKVWINGKLYDEKNACISVFDRGFMYGDGLFETMRSYDGVIFKMDEHLTRLEASLRKAGIRSRYAKRRLKREVYKLLDINKLKNAYIRLTITRGEGRFGIEYDDIFKPNVVIVAKEFGNYPEWMFEKGISAYIVNTRQNDLSPLSAMKSLNFMNYIIARFEAKAFGADEAIILNTKGHVVESPTSNIFAVKRNVVITSSIASGALPGITRSIVTELAGRLGMNVREKNLTPKELTDSNEIFLTNSLIEILPVTKIGRNKIGSGLPGRITKLLHIAYRQAIIHETQAILCNKLA
jgi:branched-chain amino acid aminotransferase